MASTLKEQAGAVISGGSIWLRKTLVAAQVTLSLLLLIGAGFVRGRWAICAIWARAFLTID